MKGFLQFLKSKVFFKQLGLAVLIFVLLFFLLQFWLDRTTNHNQRIEVPNLHKKTFAEVQQILKELDLEFKVVDSASFNPNYPKKSVIEQNPEAGGFVKEKRKIYLTLNPSKYRDLVIPDLLGKTKRQATTHLQSIGFKVSKKHTYVKDLGKDIVRGLRFNDKVVQPGDKLPKKSTISLVLGDGNR